MTDMGLPGDLPPGHLVTPRLWVSDARVPDVASCWIGAELAHGETGWWPLLLTPDFDIETFGPPDIEHVDAERFLARRWQSEEIQFFTDPAAVEDAAQLIPYPHWPGLAAAVGPSLPPDAVAASTVAAPQIEAGRLSDPFSHLELHADTRIPNPLLGHGGHTRLALVQTTDSAGAIAASGWTNDRAGGPEATAILRSWQDRFGVRLCALGTDWLAVTVAWPAPMTATAHHRRIAAEHVAFCPDILGEVSFSEYANGLTAATIWRFWWD
jgi:hypothetical protein